MVSSRIMLFLLGTTIVSSHVLRQGKCEHRSVLKVKPEGFMKMGANEITSLPVAFSASQPFIQKGTNLYYKPQFVLPNSAYPLMPMPITAPFLNVAENKKEPQPAVTEVIIKQHSPVLPPLTMPEAPAPLEISVYEEPAPEPKPIELHPCLPEEPALVEVPVNIDPIEIPEAPVLPSFIMPKLPTPGDIPVYVETAPEPKPIEMQPYLPEELSLDEIPVNMQSIEIPEAPVLPSFIMPKLPTPGDIPVYVETAPEPKPIEMQPYLPEEPSLDEIPVNMQPIEIPEAPVLPSFIIPKLPTPGDIPVYVETAPEPKPIEMQPYRPEEPSFDEIPVNIDPIEIPEAPVLPSFIMPKLPTLGDIPVYVKTATEPKPIEMQPWLPEEPALVEIPVNIKPIEIPEASVLPSFIIPELPTLGNIPVYVKTAPEPKPIEMQPWLPQEPALVEMPVNIEPIEIPEAPVLPPFIIPELPIPVYVERGSAPKPIAIPESRVFSSLPELPAPIEIPVYIEPAPAPKPIEIPEPPVLPPFILPELTTPVEDSVYVEQAPEPKPIEIPEAPVFPPLTMPEQLAPIEVPIYVEPAPTPKPIEIPEPPVLPPFIMPKSPTPIEVPVFIAPGPDPKPIEIPQPLVLPPFFMPAPVEVPVYVEPVSETKPIEIPEPPVLPSFTMPVQPVVVIPEIKWKSQFNEGEGPEAPILTPVEIAPCPPADTEVVEISSKPVVIPAPPKLPPFEMPSIPIFMNEVPRPAPILEPVSIQAAPVFIPTTIPEALELPPLTISENPKPVIVERTEESCEDEEEIPGAKALPTIYMPQVPLIGSQGQTQFAYPTFLAQNIIIERVLPHMIERKNDYPISIQKIGAE